MCSQSRLHCVIHVAVSSMLSIAKLTIIQWRTSDWVLYTFLQAGQLYVLLFYAPEVLHNDGALMRVLVDKHFVVIKYT